MSWLIYYSSDKCIKCSSSLLLQCTDAVGLTLTLLGWRNVIVKREFCVGTKTLCRTMSLKWLRKGFLGLIGSTGQVWVQRHESKTHLCCCRCRYQTDPWPFLLPLRPIILSTGKTFKCGHEDGEDEEATSLDIRDALSRDRDHIHLRVLRMLTLTLQTAKGKRKKNT